METRGFDPDFLTISVPLPHISRATETEGVRTLDYRHFTILLDPVRRLAAATAVNIDGGSLVDLPRSDRWRFDDRLPEGEQIGNELYEKNDIDRGHLVRRRDPVWGEEATAAEANDDTFYYTNAAPQAAGFNQSKDTWNGIEDHVLEFALAWEHRVSVFTGPLFSDDDPEYRGAKIPLRFFKIAAWTSGDKLRSAAFLLDQSPALGDVDLSVLPEVPPLGPFKTFQVPVSDVATLACADFGPLPAADIALPRPGVAPHKGWKPLSSVSDIDLAPAN